MNQARARILPGAGSRISLPRSLGDLAVHDGRPVAGGHLRLQAGIAAARRPDAGRGRPADRLLPDQRPVPSSRRSACASTASRAPGSRICSRRSPGTSMTWPSSIPAIRSQNNHAPSAIELMTGIESARLSQHGRLAHLWPGLDEREPARLRGHARHEAARRRQHLVARLPAQELPAADARRPPAARRSPTWPAGQA